MERAPPDSATGHTMDDQAETVLVNLLRGAGRDGAAGMRAGPRHPLLGLRRTETRAVCGAVGLPFVLDPSNEDPRFVRNRIRHELLPLCASVARRDPVPVLARHAEVVRDESELLDQLALASIPDPADVRQLTSAPMALARRAVRRWFRDVSANDSPRPGDPVRPDRYPPSLAAVQAVLEVAEHRVRAAEIAGGTRVWRTAGRLRVEPATSDKVSPVTTEEVAPAAPPWAAPAVGPLLVSAEGAFREGG